MLNERKNNNLLKKCSQRRLPMYITIEKYAINNKSIWFQHYQVSTGALDHTLCALDRTRAYFRVPVVQQMCAACVGVGEDVLVCSCPCLSADVLNHKCLALECSSKNALFSSTSLHLLP